MSVSMKHADEVRDHMVRAHIDRVFPLAQRPGEQGSFRVRDSVDYQVLDRVRYCIEATVRDWVWRAK